MSYLDDYRKAIGVKDKEPEPKIPGEISYGKSKRIITPSNHEGSGYILDYIKARKLQNSYAVIPSIQKGKRELWDTKRGYWENPYRVARYHNFIRNSPPDWEPPEWMNVPMIEEAYRYIGEQNKTDDWTEWKYLSDDDPATYYLRNVMQTPPPEFLFPGEAEEIKQQIQINTWDDLYPYQQTYQSIMAPQPLTVDDGTDRPWESKLLANTARSGLQAVAGAGIGAAIMKIATAIGVVAGSTATVIPAVIGATFFIGSMYQTNTGKKLPVIGDMLEWMGVAGKPAQFTEQAIGVGEQVLDNDLTTILDEFGPAWDASGANYETNVRNLVMDLWTKGAMAVGAEGAAEEMITDPGEVYRWEMGLTDPQMLPEGYKAGIDALNDMRTMIVAGADPIKVVEDYKAQFGLQGITNDFILQNIFDPLNYAPTIMQAGLKKYAKVTGNLDLSVAAGTITPANVIVDGMPMPLNYLVTWMSGGKLQGAAGILDGVLKYKTFIETGQFPGYKGVPDDFIPPKDYTQAQKTLGDLTDEGIPKYYIPDETQSGLRGLFKKIVNLTPASKAELSFSNMMDGLSVLAYRAGDDVSMVVKMIKTAGEIDTATTAKQFEQIVNPEGMSGNLLEPQNFITPIGGALADGLKKVNTDGIIDDFYTNKWGMPSERRAALYKIAEILEVKPGEVLDQLFVKDLDISASLKNKALDLGIKDFDTMTKDTLKDMFEIFTGEDAYPIHADLFKEQLIEMIGEKLKHHIAARFGLKNDSKFMRFAGILKDMQSLLVLGFNPGYMVNNLVNNIMTRTADGIFGVMTRKQINGYLERFEILPTRMDMGLSDSSLARDAFGITSEGKVTRVSDVIKMENDLIDAAGKVVKDVRKKIGIFSNLSAKIEQSESRQAYISALRHMQSNLWRRDVGIRPLPDNLKQALGEDTVRQLYEVAEKSLNKREINDNFYGKGNPTVTEMLQRILDAFEGRNQNLTGNQDMYREILSSTGILDDLDVRLKTAKSMEDIDNAFVEVQGTIDNKIRDMIGQEIETNIEAKKIMVQSEGITAAISEFTDVEMEFMRTWITHFNELEDLFSRKPNMTSKEFGRQYKMLRQRDDTRFERLFDWEGSTTKGVLEAFGYDENVPSVKVILDSHKETANNWREFYKFRDEAYQKLIDEDYADSESWTVAKAETDKNVQEMAEAAYELEQNNYQKMNESYISLSKNKELAREWRDEVTAIRQDMIKGMTEFRKSLAEDPPETMMERNYRWSEFIRQEYQPRIVALKSAESLIQKMNKSVLGDEGSLRNYIVNNPIDDTVPDQLKIKIQQEAESMISELNEGSPGRRIVTQKEDSATGRMEAEGIIAEPTTNVSWYRKLFHGDASVNRATVENALKYLAEGNTRSNKYSKGLKELIVNRLLGREPRGYDAGALEGMKNAAGDKVQMASADEFIDMDPEAAWLLGEKDTAAWELNDLINNRPDDIDGKFQDQSIKDKAYDYWANDWLAKNTVKEMLDNTGRFSEDQVINVMSLYEFRAEQWARDTGNHPREWFNKYIREIKYADEPEKVLHELFQTGETSSTWYYSNLLRTVEGMPNRMPADQMKGWLKGKVKKEEMGDIGFDQWLKQQEGMVEKSDALDFLSENAVRVEEVIKVSDSADPLGRNNEIAAKYNRPELLTEGEHENYRELLLTLPLKKRYSLVEDSDNMLRIYDNATGKPHIRGSGEMYEYPLSDKTFANDWLKQMNTGGYDQNYQSSHWQETNTLAWLRFNDRIDAEGKKVLYIEEIQSDWHQKGRTEGYKGDFTKFREEVINAAKKNNSNMKQVERALDYLIEEPLDTPDRPTMNEWQILHTATKGSGIELNQLHDIGDSIIPDAPFKKSWNSLSMKRMLRWASENGYDRVAWTTGEIQADRYNLQKVADVIRYYPDANELKLYRLANEPNQMGIRDLVDVDRGMFKVEPDKLPDYVGKDVANNLLNDGRMESMGFGEVRGDQLQVGGQGMKAFYDKIMVSDTNKLIKKYGGRVGETAIEAPGMGGEGGRLRYEVFDAEGNMQDAFPGFPEAEEAALAMGTGHYVQDAVKEGSHEINVHSFDILDNMRQKAIEGIPLYQIEQDLFSLAKKYGIPTATTEGKPNNKQLLNTINKYSGEKYKKLDDVPIDIAHKALEARRIEKGEPSVKDALIRGAVSFDEDGAALMRLGEAADISTIVHETGHMFRRQLSGDDLEVIAKWTGLDNAEEMVRLEQKFDNGTIDDVNRKRYIESEEKFAEGFTKYMAEEHKSLPMKVQAVFARFAQWLRGVFDSLSKKHDMDINATVEVNGQQVRVKDVLDRMFVKLEGENQLGTTPEPFPQAKALSEVADMYLYPIMDTAKDVYKRNHQSYKPFNVEGIPDQYRADVKKWVNGLENDLASTKLVSMKYAEGKRDQALINYSRRTGLDEMLSVPFPYIFWYTKSMMNWATRMLDQPKLFATYARYRQMQEKMEREGIPQRLGGKIRLNAPYLPDWMGGGLWQDPMRQIFPFAQMNDPVDRAAYMQNSLKHETYTVLNEMAEAEKITAEQAQIARESMEGEFWDIAQSEAANRVGTFDPMSLASIMASPAMYFDIPWKLMQGTPEKIQVTPFLKTTQAVETLTQDTFLSGVGKAIGGIGDITEGALRRKAMTPAIAMFGEYGDYYVDRQLANMVADGEIGIREAKTAMVERTGEVYAMAVNRVREEVALRIPGAASVMAAKNGANLPQFAASVFHSLNPSGLLPEGELEYLNLKDEYSHAWEMYNRGYKDQLTQFFEDHPVFEARIAIKDDPDERLQNFLVSEIWDRYMSLGSANKQLVHDQLGPQFSDTFMEQRVYDAIPVDKLALWAHSIGGVLPQAEGVPMMDDVPMVEQWSEDAANSYQVYSDTRNEQFPNWYAVQTRYFDQPQNKRRSYLADHPELKEYWDWKNEYRAAHPEIEPILAYKSAQYQQENEMMNMEMLEAMPDELIPQLQSYSLLGTNMGPGAWEALRYEWERLNKPYGNLKEWVDEVVVNSVR